MTSVAFGGVPAVSFTVNGDNSITAVTPAALAAGTVDVSVANVLGVSAVTPADRFQYLGSVPGSRSPAAGGRIAVFPTASGMTVSASSTTGCAVCEVRGGIELLGPQAPKCRAAPPRSCCPRAGSRRRRMAAAYSASSRPRCRSEATNDDQSPGLAKLVSVCFVNGVPTPVSPLIAGDQLATAAAAPKAPKAVKLRACSKEAGPAVPPRQDGDRRRRARDDAAARDGRDVPRRHAGRQDQPPQAGIRVSGRHDHDRGRNMGAVTGVWIGGAEAVITARTRRSSR